MAWRPSWPQVTTSAPHAGPGNAKKSVFARTGSREAGRASMVVAAMETRAPTAESKPSVLIVDDDQALCDMLDEYLTLEGFSAVTAATGPEGLEQLVRCPVDLVILDVMLPELSGIEVLRRIRAVSRVPVIMLTARGEEVDRVVGLEMGADDYLAKPFSPRELVARIRAVLRRAPGESSAEDSLLQWGPLRLDLRARRAEADAHDLELTSAELRILELLARLRTETGTGVVVASRDAEVARTLADVIVVLDDGEVIESGPAAQILESPRHHRTRALVESRRSA